MTGGVPADLTVDLSNFYVQILARPDAALSSALLESPCCTLIHEQQGEVVLDPSKKIRITERAYLNPDSEASCGPDHTTLLSMIVLGRS